MDISNISISGYQHEVDKYLSAQAWAGWTDRQAHFEIPTASLFIGLEQD